MGAKIELLRRLGAVEELERRFEQDEEFGEIYDVSRLSMPASVADRLDAHDAAECQRVASTLRWTGSS
ncbi:hypothetical protein [Nocardia asteroides]|uniref:hypothetical protein n=1 Tax=Nocardia asteroides TaxID=1824 RepID=UPI003647052D